jgi:hypothetical protein
MARTNGPGRWKRFLLAPAYDLRAAFSKALPERPWPGLGAVFVGFAASGWLYVPVHELLHAFGCLAAGGTVDRLELDPQYGAALLQKVFPFVAVGSEYAGQLTGFDTHGNDLTYLVTVFAPFVTTILLGVWLMRTVARFRRPGILPCLLIGVATPHAFAPFVNLIGDYYEMGSILTSRAVAVFDPGLSLEAWRSDDLLRTARELLSSGAARPGDVAVLLLGALLGTFLAFATYWAGGVFSDLVTRNRRGGE